MKKHELMLGMRLELIKTFFAMMLGFVIEVITFMNYPINMMSDLHSWIEIIKLVVCIIPAAMLVYRIRRVISIQNDLKNEINKTSDMMNEIFENQIEEAKMLFKQQYRAQVFESITSMITIIAVWCGFIFVLRKYGAGMIAIVSFIVVMIAGAIYAFAERVKDEGLMSAIVNTGIDALSGIGNAVFDTLDEVDKGYEELSNLIGAPISSTYQYEDLGDRGGRFYDLVNQEWVYVTKRESNGKTLYEDVNSGRYWYDE